ncbi:MAG: molybdenum cofactor guanylyltransferase [Candidatus Dadabacteria bacterium]
MTGVVLCGGISSRMGSDKGLLEIDEKKWVENSAFLLSSLDIPVFISVNQKQVDSYSRFFTKQSLLIDNAILHLKGPLLGIMSVHLKIPGEDLFVLACDMIRMKEAVLDRMFREYTAGDADAYVYAIQNNREPLCAIYTSSALEKINELVYTHQLKNFSMMNVLDKLRTEYLAVEPHLTSCFKNVNSPEELI